MGVISLAHHLILLIYFEPTNQELSDRSVEFCRIADRDYSMAFPIRRDYGGGEDELMYTR
jgi:hypothetical protein